MAQGSEEEFMTARGKDERTNSENFYSAMHTAKQSLSKSTSNEQLVDLNAGKGKESFNYSQERSNTMDEPRKNINGTVSKKTSQGEPSAIEDFLKETKLDCGDSVNSDEIRERAREIIAIYNARLKEEGEKSFQVRLNIFFTFVRDNSVEAEAYDLIQSVEGSVMNHDSIIIEEDDEESSYSRNSSRTGSINNPSEHLPTKE